jgi:DNA-binding beta-propeller fold protein YncE
LLSFSIINAEFIYDKTLNGTKGDELFNNPISLWVDENYIYVSDTSMQIVYMLEYNGEVQKKIGYSRSSINELDEPKGIFLFNEEIYICDDKEIKIYKKRPSLDVFSKNIHFYSDPYAIAFVDRYFYILDKSSSRVYIHNSDESYNQTYINKGRFNSQFDGPSDIFVGPNNYLYIADSGNNRIQVVDQDFNFIRNIGKGRDDIFLKDPRGVFVNDKFVFVADTGNNRIVVFDLLGNLLETLGTEGDEKYEFYNPEDVFYFDGKVYVADTGNSRVEIYDFEFELLMDTTLEKLNIAEEKLESLQLTLEKTNKLGINSSIDISEYYKSAEYYYLESNYQLSQEKIEEFDKKYDEAIKEINEILEAELQEVSKDIESYLLYYSNLYNLSPEQELFIRFEYSFFNDEYIESLEYLYSIHLSLENFKNPNEVLLETDEFIEERLNNSKEELDLLKFQAEKYKQTINFNSLDQKLEVAISYVEVGDLINTRKSLDIFDTEFDLLNISFSETKSKIDQALEKIIEAESKNNPIFNNELKKAKTIVYEDPEAAKEIAEKALGSSFDVVNMGFLIIILVLLLALFLSHKVFKKTKRGRYI